MCGGYFFVKLEGNAPAIRLPLEEGDAPNVFVSVVVLRGSEDSPKKFKMPEYRIGYTQVRITRPDAKLYVNVKPERRAVSAGRGGVGVLRSARRGREAGRKRRGDAVGGG